MSYSSDIKTELRDDLVKNNCCKRAILLGMLVLRSRVIDGTVRFFVSDRDTLLLMNSMIRDQFSKEPVFIDGEYVFSSHSCASSLRDFEHLPYDTALKRRCRFCTGAFLRGVFIATGNVTDPERDYRLDFISGDLSEKLSDFLVTLGFAPKISTRRKERVVYFRNSSAIEDFFATIAATGATFDIINSKIHRDMRNDANRIANCEMNNINRAVDAARKHIETIERLIAANKLSFLPPELERTARFRIDNRELSLSQLAAAMTPPISKSGLNHRLSKIMEIAEQLLID